MRKRLLSWLSTLLILTGTLLPSVSATAERADVIPAGSWGLSTSGPVYANGNTTWAYSFSRKGNPQAMQQLDLALCRSFNATNVTASHGGSVQSSPGPRVIKWETSAMGDGDTITVTYAGLWASGSQSWSIATERDIFRGQVTGPACEVLAPDFTVSKTVSPVDDASQAKSNLTLTGGGTVYYFYTITNTGNSPINIESLVDESVPGVTFPSGEIPPGQSVTAPPVSRSFPELAPGSPAQTDSGTVTATGSFAGKQAGPRAASATVTNEAATARPDFSITKTASESSDSPGTDSLTLEGGGTVWYHYTFENAGNVPLTIQSAVDDKLGNISFPTGTIAPGESVTAVSDPVTFAPLPPGSDPEVVENIVTVTAGYRGGSLSHEDTATVTNNPLPASPGFVISNLVNTVDDRGTAGEHITLTGGGTAYFFYAIENTGDVPLTIVSAEDELAGDLVWDQTVLAPGAVAQAEASQVFPPLPPGSAPDNLENVLTVSLAYETSPLPTQTDSSTVSNQAPPIRETGSFTVEKRVSGHPDSPGESELVLSGGGTAYFTIIITNTGTLPLFIDLVDDDVLGDLTPGHDPVAPGESVEIKAEKSFAPLAPGSADEIETNTVTVEVMYANESFGSATDQATVINRAPAVEMDFTLTKRVSPVNDPASGQASITLTGGGTAYYFYTLTNTGNVELTIAEATDDILGGLTFTPAVVPVGGMATATASKTFPALAAGTPDQTETNTAAVTAIFQATPLSKSAQATVINKAKTGGGGGGCCVVPNPQTRFTLTKQASTVNDPATGQDLVTLAGGGTVFYFYTLTNTGETVITIEAATDDKLGALTFEPLTLLPGETAEATAQKHFGALPPGVAVKSETNTASLTLKDNYGRVIGPVTAHATVVNEPEPVQADFTVSKRASTSPDPADGTKSLTLPAEGGTVYYFYTVTNTGNVELTITEAVDDKLGPVTFSPAVLPVGGTATAMLSKTFGPGDAGLIESNVVTVRTTHDGVVYGPKTDAVSVQVAVQELGSLDVRVMDGSPRNTGIFPAIPGASVTLSNGMTGQTDSSGRILFTGLPYGRYNATASAVDPQNPTPDTLRSGQGSATLGARTPDEVITIVLAWDPPSAPPAFNPSITVTVCPTFAKLGGEVMAAGPDGESAKGVLQNDGTYLISGLTAGAWTITMSGPGLAEPVTRTLHLRSDNAVPNNAYSLDLSAVCPAATGSVAGRICSVREPGAQIRGEGPSGLTALVTIPSDGRLGQWREYQLAGLAPGEWKLTLQTPGNPPVSQSVSVRAGESTRAADFTLACTGQPAPVHPSTWYYLGGLLIAAGLLLRRWARA